MRTCRYYLDEDTLEPNLQRQWRGLHTFAGSVVCPCTSVAVGPGGESVATGGEDGA